MQALFVHGMGRSPLSGGPMLKRLRAHGIETHTFGYMVSLESFESIRQRLRLRIMALARQGDYIAIGHSLGGVLIRAALQDAQPGMRPARIFLLGSPVRPSRIARRLHANPLYRRLAGDCGQLLASHERMAEIEIGPGPITGIVGTRHMRLTLGLFNGAANDGVVAVDEVIDDHVPDSVRVDVLHTWLPSNPSVSDVILRRLAGNVD